MTLKLSVYSVHFVQRTHEIPKARKKQDSNIFAALYHTLWKS